MEFGQDRSVSLSNVHAASIVLNEGSPHGKRKKAAGVNYHTMTNNAIFPTEEVQDVIHYTSKRLPGDNLPRLAPTLRKVSPGSPSHGIEYANA